MLLDLTRYHDLTKRLAAFGVDGGQHLRGDTEDVQVVDAEVAMRAGEREHARVVGMVQLIGGRTTTSEPDPSLGLVLEGGGLAVVTTERVVVMASTGASQLGAIKDEVHTFSLPWDLVDSVSMPVKRSFADRIGGGRTIDVFAASVMVSLRVSPFGKAEIGGSERRVTDEDVMQIIVRAAAEHRIGVSAPADHARLRALLEGPYERDGDEITAVITQDSPDTELPRHLEGRIVLHGDDPELQAQPQPEPEPDQVFCIACGHRVRATAKYCTACGERQPTE